MKGCIQQDEYNKTKLKQKGLLKTPKHATQLQKRNNIQAYSIHRGRQYN